jgi:hypothetical protein
MVPDRGFVKQLKCLNKDFEVVWDYGSVKWEIWCVREDGPPYHVTTVQTKDRNYRELSTQVLLELQKSMYLNRNLTTDELLDYFEEMDNQIRRRKERDFRNKLQAIASETFLHSAQVLQLSVPRSYKVERSISDAGTS